MIRVISGISACVLAFGLLAPARGADRPAKQIVDDIKAIKKPTSADDAKAARRKKADLIGELLKAYPKNDQLPRLLPERWRTLGESGGAEEALTEIDAALAASKSVVFKAEATYLKAKLMAQTKKDGADDVAVAYIKIAPSPRRAADLLYEVSQDLGDVAKKALEEKILKDFAATDAAKRVKEDRSGGGKPGKVGKPFELEFDDAISGSHVAMKDLKGKVVVIDFWATWCGPCVAEMPTMKKLYAEYKDKGVEFIGVSLDQPKEKGGLDALKKFVEKNEIKWPQYYQGNFWQSKFSSSWKVNGIPCVFIVDTEGNLHSTEARGKLEKLIPELLKKGKGDLTASSDGR